MLHISPDKSSTFLVYFNSLLDLKTGKTAPPGEETLSMRFVRQPLAETRGQVYDWSFEVNVPKGGLLLSTNQFDFMAPESGYVPSDVIEMPATLGETWQTRLNRTYFVKLPDGNFARIILDLMSHNGSLRIQSFTNPSGSRNLEFDPSNVAPGGN
jgi:hypothetical protein